MDKTYKYLGYYLLLLIPLIFAGFYKSYFQPFPNFGENINVFVNLNAFVEKTTKLKMVHDDTNHVTSLFASNKICQPLTN